MKTIHLILIFLLPITSLIGQERKMLFGVDANPIKLFGGHYEGVVLANWSKRIKSKVSLGYTRSSFLRLSCKEGDDIEDRRETGWFGKFKTDFTFYSSNKIDLYGGGAIFYTDFTTKGVRRLAMVEEKVSNSGALIAFGGAAGIRFKEIKFFLLDVGIEMYQYSGDRHQIGSTCRGVIPGIGNAGGEKILFSIFAHVLL